MTRKVEIIDMTEWTDEQRQAFEDARRMTPEQCEAAFDRLIDATNHMNGGGPGGYQWALGKLLRQMGDDFSGHIVARVMAELGWAPLSKN